MVQRSSASPSFFHPHVQTLTALTFSQAGSEFLEPENNFRGVVTVPHALFFSLTTLLQCENFHVLMPTEKFHRLFSRKMTDFVI